MISDELESWLQSKDLLEHVVVLTDLLHSLYGEPDDIRCRIVQLLDEQSDKPVGRALDGFGLSFGQ